MLWAGQWHSKSSLDGDVRHILYENCLPVLRRTRSEMREYIEQKYGYIRDRADLRQQPHGWRIPQAVKVEIIIAQ
jgi:hypothetical protein